MIPDAPISPARPRRDAPRLVCCPACPLGLDPVEPALPPCPPSYRAMCESFGKGRGPGATTGVPGDLDATEEVAR